MEKCNKKMCKDCPFKKTSAKGWLGSHNTDHFINIIESDLKLPCHNTMDKNAGFISNENIEKSKKMRQCAGMLFMMNNCGKRSKNKKVSEWQDQVGKNDNAFAHKSFFKSHHESLK